MSAQLPPLTYLTVDSLQEGVGASQVLPYVVALARRGLDVRLNTLEKRAPVVELQDRLRHEGVRWYPHHFGGYGPAHGLWRVLRGRRWLRQAELVHARSDLAAASTLLARPKHWLWDVRSLFPDQRVALGFLRPGSPEERILRMVEGRAAGGSDGIVTLTAAAIDVLAERYGPQVPLKARVVPTCVALDRFPVSPLPTSPPINMLLSGTLNSYYDVPAMLRFVKAVERRAPTRLRVLTSPRGPFEQQLTASGAKLTSVPHEHMPAEVAAAHVGLSVCRLDAGISLTAAMPTKVAEFLASGRPVVVNRGLGDFDALLQGTHTGVVLQGTEDHHLERGVDELLSLLEDTATPEHCRALAEHHFSLDRGVDQLMEAYSAIMQGP